jgi:hypothetical protein
MLDVDEPCRRSPSGYNGAAAEPASHQPGVRWTVTLSSRQFQRSGFMLNEMNNADHCT